jgi:membrane-associated phospholipid phosphatase
VIERASDSFNLPRKVTFMYRTINLWLLSLVSTTAFVIISVRWFDKPIAAFFGGVIKRESFEFADRILAIPNVAAVLFILLGLSAIGRRRFSKVEAVVAICIICVLITTVIKDQLKFVFGRSWPYLLQYDVYEFNFFKSERFLESFPSGHAAVAAAILSVVWTRAPKARGACAIAILAADLGLVVLDLHFLSDVVAGTFVGVSVGLFTTALWEAIEPTLRGA